jgi:hypothetical protein
VKVTLTVQEAPEL